MRVGQSSPVSLVAGPQKPKYRYPRPAGFGTLGHARRGSSVAPTPQRSAGQSQPLASLNAVLITLITWYTPSVSLVYEAHCANPQLLLLFREYNMASYPCKRITTAKRQQKAHATDTILCLPFQTRVALLPSHTRFEPRIAQAPQPQPPLALHNRRSRPGIH